MIAALNDTATVQRVAAAICMSGNTNPEARPCFQKCEDCLDGAVRAIREIEAVLGETR